MLCSSEPYQPVWGGTGSWKPGKAAQLFPALTATLLNTDAPSAEAAECSRPGEADLEKEVNSCHLIMMPSTRHNLKRALKLSGTVPWQ